MKSPPRVRTLALRVAFLRTFFGIVLLATPVASQGQPSSAWDVQTSGTTANLWAIARGPGPVNAPAPPSDTIVAVGEQGVILTSFDAGAAWTRRESGSRARLTGVAYSATAARYVVVGEGGLILSSADAVVWTTESSPTQVQLNAVSEGYVAGTFQAVGEAGAGLLTRRLDGSWVRTDVGFGNRAMRAVQPRWAVGENGGIFGPLFTRFGAIHDPTPWLPYQLPTGMNLDAVATAFEASSGLLTSTLVAGSNGTLLEFKPAVDGGFVPRPSGTTERLRGICYQSGGTVTVITAIVRVPLGERFVVGDAGTILRSADGVSWHRDPAPTLRNLNAVAASGRFVFAVGDGGTLLRTGGASQQPILLSPPTVGYTLSGEPRIEALAAGPGALTYYWVQLTGGAPYPVGSDGPLQKLPTPLFPRSGPPVYQLHVANAFGLVRSEAVAPKRFLNLSARAEVGTGEATLIGGFTVASPSPEQLRTLLVRAVGPTLGQFGVARALTSPRLSVYAGSQLLGSNTGWSNPSGAAAISDAARVAGAFALPPGSGDAALLLTLTAGNYTAQVESADGSAGSALVEVYDVGAPTVTRLANVSTRSNIDPSRSPLISGFVISGGLRKTVLLRAVGPTLAAFGLESALARPRLTLFRGSTEIASTAAWSASPEAPALAAAARDIGAFAFPEGSADAALLIELEPGAYTLQVSSADGGRGIALAEVYELL